jgi:O-antigen/teichoic acid export membrane protein
MAHGPARGAAGAAAGTGQHDWQALAPLSQLSNGLTLIAAKAITMGLGFAFWVLAARLFVPREVGLAAGVVSAMMLCTQLAQLGFGSAFITHFPQLKRRPGPLLDTSFTLVAALGAVWALLFLLFASVAFHQLNVVTGRADFALLFVTASVFGTLGILFDQVATALRRGEQALVRNVAFGIGTVALLATLPLVAGARDAESLFLPWAAAGLLASVMGLRQLRRTLPAYRPRLAVDRALAGDLVRSGLPNYALTLAERAPGLILPVIVAELLSPGANATWYTIWMMAWVIYIVPIQVGMTIFSEVSHDPAALRETVRRGVLCSLGVGTAGALVLGVGAPVILSILGSHYADGGAGPLRVLLVAFVPLTFVQAYFSSCRARRRLREAIVTGWVNAVASVGLATAAGVTHGLMGMAVAWVAVQFLTGAWSLWRLRSIDARANVVGNGLERRPLPTGPGLESA